MRKNFIKLIGGLFVVAAFLGGMEKNVYADASCILSKTHDNQENKEYTDFDDALKDAADGATITLKNDINKPILFDGAKAPHCSTLTIDLNGKTIESGTNVGYVIKIDQNHKLTLTSGKDEGKVCCLSNSAIVSNYGTFVLNGGTIEEIIGSGNPGLIGVFNNGTFTMNGGSICNCNEGVSNYGSFTMSGGSISDCFNNLEGAGVYNDGSFVMEGGKISNCSVGDEGRGGGGVYITNDGTFTMKGGSITGCTAGKFGGGVYINYEGIFTMEDGEISNCSTGDNAGRGGGVYVNYDSNQNKGGTFIMKGGEITGCKAYLDGGGVFVKDSNNSGASFTMSGGEISGCESTFASGGGVCLGTKTSFTMSGGSITGCKAEYLGGGIYKATTADIKISGKSYVKDNLHKEKNPSEVSDIYVYKTDGYDYKPLELAGNFTGSIGLYMDKNVSGRRIGGDSQRGAIFGSAGQYTLSSANNFFSNDNPGLFGYVDENHNLCWGYKYTVSFDMKGVSPDKAPEPKDVVENCKLMAFDAPVVSGYILEGWYKDNGCTEKWDFNADVVTEDMTLFAKWAEKKVSAISITPKMLTLDEGKTGTISSIIEPNDALNTKLYWASSNEDIAKVELLNERDVTVIAVKEGECVITATTADGTNISDTCKVTVLKNETPDPEKKEKDDALPFTDVAEGKWYSKPDGPIAYVFAKGIMKGTGDGSTFSPDGDCTREMFVQILYNAEGAPGPGASNPFSDVPEGKWYTDAVTWAVENGVTKGTSDTTFGVKGKITREQLAQFLLNYATAKNYDISATADLSVFPDNDQISGWAQKAISWANANGIINGKSKAGEKVLDPKAKATRAEVAQMIMNFQKKFED